MLAQPSLRQGVGPKQRKPRPWTKGGANFKIGASQLNEGHFPVILHCNGPNRSWSKVRSIMSDEKDESNDLNQASQHHPNTEDLATPSKGGGDGPKVTFTSPGGINTGAVVTARAKRRREEAVRRLVSDIQARSDKKYGGGEGGVHTESQDWIVASTVATALERGLDRDLHHELVQEAKENSGRIGQVCHDHSDVFLASVGKVVALGGPAADLANKLLQAQEELEVKTSGPMRGSAVLWEEAKQSHARAQALYILVNACQRVSKWLERARKQAALGRPRAALEAVDEARTALTSPLTSLFFGAPMEHASSLLREVTMKKREELGTKDETTSSNKSILSMEETPFGRRALAMLPKIENEVLMGARRGLNRWFLALRSGGDGAKAGRAVLRKSAHSIAVGPGGLGLGGHVPPSYCPE
jgi:exocyst complex component 6